MCGCHGGEQWLNVDVLGVQWSTNGIAQDEDILTAVIVSLGGKDAVISSTHNANKVLDILDGSLSCTEQQKPGVYT